MKIYIDVSNLMHVSFISGIQRVVREVVLRMVKEPDFDPGLLRFHEGKREFEVLSVKGFVACFEKGELAKEEILVEGVKRIRDFEPGSIFFEIDSVWHSKMKRTELYPGLKGRGVKIAVCYQDIIPIMWPQYVDQMTAASFAGYITACMSYADLFISSTHANISYLRQLMQNTGVESRASYHVSWLGTDFKTGDTRGKVRKSIQELAQEKYVLMVGTIEPRKNHSLVLDAFDHRFFEEGIRLVIAGRCGWNVSLLEQRLRKHPRLGKELYWIEDANDAEIEALYKGSYLVAFPSHTEGFGLPIVEAAARNVPVISADHPVMREVGGAWCDYFDAKDEKSFGKCLDRYLSDEKYYIEKKENLKTFETVSWDTVERRIAAALRSLEYSKSYRDKDEAWRKKRPLTGIRQMVILSARAEDLLRSLPFAEQYMPFIEELVLCCPDKMQAEVEEAYHGRLQIKFLTDSALTAGDPLPKDHAVRNIFLRARALKYDIIDDVFLMGDDDYRPLREITEDVYVKDGKYQAYYVKDLADWRGAQGSMTAFDLSLVRSRDYLSMKGYPTYMFDAHMPQVIDKQIYLEMLEKYPEIVSKALTSEWNGYFNYLVGEYPQLVNPVPYVAFGWPGFLEDWEMEQECPQYLFENFYDTAYEPETAYGHPGHFCGFSRIFTEGAEEENIRKIAIVHEEYEAHADHVDSFVQWKKDVREKQGMDPVMAVYTSDKGIELAMPLKMEMSAGGFLRLPVTLMLSGCEKGQEWQLTWGVYEGERLCLPLGSARFLTGERLFEVLLAAPEKEGEYRVEWNLFTDSGRVYRNMVMEASAARR